MERTIKIFALLMLGGGLALSTACDEQAEYGEEGPGEGIIETEGQAGPLEEQDYEADEQQLGQQEELGEREEGLDFDSPEGAFEEEERAKPGQAEEAGEEGEVIDIDSPEGAFEEEEREPGAY